MNSPEPSEPVSRLLGAWLLEPARNLRFRTAISARLHPDGESTAWSDWSDYLRAHAGAVAATLVLAIVVGAFTGREQARARLAAEREQLATSYVQALDARAMVMP